MSETLEPQQPLSGAREVPARLLPVPDTVSPEMQALIAQRFDPSFNIAPETAAEWKARVAKAALTTVAALPRLREELGVTAEPATVAGVKTFTVTPRSMPRRTGTLCSCTSTAASGC